MKLEHYLPYLITLFLVSAVACSQGGTSSPQPAPTPSPTSTSYTASKSTDNTLTTLNSLTLDKCVATANYSLVYTYAASQTATVSQTSESGYEETAANDDRFAQSFHSPADGVLTSLKLKLARAAIDTTATVTIRERGPNGFLRSMNSINLTSTTLAWLNYVPPTEVRLEKNKQYTIVVQRGVANVRWARSTAGSSVGDGFVSNDAGATWTMSNTLDFTFDIMLRTASETWQYSFNGVSSTAYSTYPASQIININGKEAGILNFTTNPSAPAAASETDTVSVKTN